MDDKLKIAQLLWRIDQACSRMNAGLAAFATMLATMVVFMSVLRAAEIAIDLGATLPNAANPTGQPFINLWTYD
jgi:hypothetical protein